MTRYVIYGATTLLLLSITSCTSHYKLSDIDHSRIVIDSRYDSQPDQAAADFLRPFKAKVDSVMSPVVGRAAHDMAADRPESNLSNLLSDILIWAGKYYDETPVLGVYNMGGIRASLVKGDVTYGDILDVAPFENKICFLTLSGDELLELFRQMASRGAEGVSHGVRMVINKKLELLSVRLNGKEIVPQQMYRIATIDFLAQGNDGLEAFKKSRQVNAPKEKSNNLRNIIIRYFQEKAALGEEVSAKVEGRVVVSEE